jgi:hypothetical protein
MKPTEIINAEYQRLGKDPSKFLRGLKIAIGQKLAIILQEGDSILILITIGETTFHLSFVFISNLKLGIESLVCQFNSRLAVEYPVPN